MLKEIRRKSVLWLCLAVGLLAGSAPNLLAKVEQGCWITFINAEGIRCWGAVFDCEWCDSGYFYDENWDEWWYLGGVDCGPDQYWYSNE